MPPAGWKSWLFDGLFLLVVGVISSVWCVTAATRLSATFDEPIYIEKGLERWRTGSYAQLMKLGTMPLPVDVETLPLHLWERWRGQPFGPVNDFEQLLPVARAANLVFWWLLLTYGMLAGRALAGPWGGRVAIVLLAFEPSLLANAALATTDISIAACMLALVYHYAVGRQRGWLLRVGLPGFWFAAALLAKASALAFAPLCLLAVEGYWFISRFRSPADCPSVTANLRSAAIRLTQIAVIGLALMFVYVGSDGQPQASLVKWAYSLPESAYKPLLIGVAENLRVFSNAGEGIVRQVTHNVRGHGSYLLGQWHPRYFWYYFPVALTIKLSVPLLLTPVVIGILRPRALFNWANLAALALLLFSLQCHVQIGVRLVLPLVVLGIVGLAGAAVNASQSPAPLWRRRLALAWTGAAACLVVVAGWSVWPHGLCFTNLLYGGTRAGYRHVSDANYDWGQGLLELADWQRQRGDVPLDVWYFGTDPRLKRLPMRHQPFHQVPIESERDLAALVRGRYVAVSTTVIALGQGGNPAHRRALEFLQQRPPVARTATFFIYDFTNE